MLKILTTSCSLWGHFLLGSCTLALFTGPAVSADLVWWEGENHVATNFREHPWVKMQPAERQKLSRGDWHTHMHKPQFEAPAGGYYFARYRVRIPQASRYHLWSRQWSDLKTAAEWRFDDQPWREAGPELPREDNVEIAPDRSAAWFRYGEVELAAGEHSFEIRLVPRPGIAAFDCFVLGRGRFQPAGSRKPNGDAAEFYQYPKAQRSRENCGGTQSRGRGSRPARGRGRSFADRLRGFQPRGPRG